MKQTINDIHTCNNNYQRIKPVFLCSKYVLQKFNLRFPVLEISPYILDSCTTYTGSTSKVCPNEKVKTEFYDWASLHIISCGTLRLIREEYRSVIAYMRTKHVTHDVY